jgi:hypothetical protein
MNAAQVILEGLFLWKVSDNLSQNQINRGAFCKVRRVGAMNRWHTLTKCALERMVSEKLTKHYGSVHAAAEKAAEYLNKQLKNSQYVDKSYKYDERNGCWEFRTDIANLSPTFVESFNHLELIAEAVGAGWEKGEGVE